MPFGGLESACKRATGHMWVRVRGGPLPTGTALAILLFLVFLEGARLISSSGPLYLLLPPLELIAPAGPASGLGDAAAWCLCSREGTGEVASKCPTTTSE